MLLEHTIGNLDPLYIINIVPNGLEIPRLVGTNNIYLFDFYLLYSPSSISVVDFNFFVAFLNFLQLCSVCNMILIILQLHVALVAWYFPKEFRDFYILQPNSYSSWCSVKIIFVLFIFKVIIASDRAVELQIVYVLRYLVN